MTNEDDSTGAALALFGASKRVLGQWVVTEVTGMLVGGVSIWLERPGDGATLQVIVAARGQRALVDTPAGAVLYHKHSGLTDREAGETTRAFAALLERGEIRLGALFPHLLFGPKPDAAARARVLQLVGAQGPSLCVSTACATGNHSIGEAWRAIRAGDADRIFAGGAEAAVIPLGLNGFAVMKALSKRNDDPATASRPFDAERDGFVMGEGAGILVLEELEHARRRGVAILAELVGYGLTNDAHHDTAPAPGGAGAARCMRMALRSAGMPPDAVDYINAHGTSTPQNDVNETQAIKSVFGDHAKKLAISSTKSVTGHLLGAAGGVEAVAAVMALRTGILPPTANLHNPDPNCDLDYVPNQARRSNPQVVLSNAFGFGGCNATLVFRRWED